MPDWEPVYFSKFLFKILRQIRISLFIKFHPARPDPTDVSSKVIFNGENVIFNSRNNQTLPHLPLLAAAREADFGVLEPLCKH